MRELIKLGRKPDKISERFKESKRGDDKDELFNKFRTTETSLLTGGSCIPGYITATIYFTKDYDYFGVINEDGEIIRLIRLSEKEALTLYEKAEEFPAYAVDIVSEGIEELADLPRDDD